MRLWWLAVMALVLLGLAGCKRQPADEAGTVPVKGKSTKVAFDPTKDDPSDFLALTVGTEWVYEITLGQGDALNFGIHYWPQGGGSTVVSEVRGRYFTRDAATDGRTLLKLRLEEKAAKQGPLEYPEGYQLKVLRDDLGIYDDAKDVYWAITRSSEYMCEEVVTYAPDTPGAPSGSWGSYGLEDGFSMRPYLFGSKPGTGISSRMGTSKDDEKSPDVLYFIGPEDKDNLQFERRVDGSDDADNPGMDAADLILSRGFTNSLTFTRGKGLTKLEQTVGGETTMTWKLVEINKP